MKQHRDGEALAQNRLRSHARIIGKHPIPDKQFPPDSSSEADRQTEGHVMPRHPGPGFHRGKLQPGSRPSETLDSGFLRKCDFHPFVGAPPNAGG